ncbi:hypothetical protein PX554_08120 [Sphingomonas sp. H39-1-10]|uniref:hypothetical protein n=1 Tax=Sphingomonas TaxID=13687 RepID=UPI00087F7DFD|nr:MULTISPECIES: hypothetical protein [Sphingomonas]MDF0488095.1 hypothetical protein [Sphingomonas pollutisoli]SDA33428.1 hypothetical protein SAMN03159340_02899 [Sphingomonas sp. NFR15]
MIAGRGRPLRFIGVLVAGWIGVRAVMLWPQADAVPDPARRAAPTVRAPIAGARTAGVAVATDAGPSVVPIAPIRVAGPWHGTRAVANRLGGIAQPVLPSAGAIDAPERPQAVAPPIAGLPRPAPAAVGTARASRLSGSFWLVARGGGGVTSAPLGGQLGGSQAGLRLAYLLDRKHRLAAMARVTSPLGSGLREAALGVEWQPTRLPVRIVAEQRIAIADGKGGPAVELVGGFGPLPVGGGFRLESYAQAGAIHRERTEGFVDGAAHLSHPIGALGPIPIDLGAGLWGGAQRGAERLDVGPSITATVPIAGRAARLSLDWRERVAGAARPGSGVALTLGADF